MPGRKANWFIALPVTSDNWSATGGVETPSAIRRFHPIDLHITVAFLGPVSRRRAMNAWKKLKDVKIPDVPISFNQLKPFGSNSSPSAYSLTLSEGRDTLKDFISEHQSMLLGAVGKKPNKRRVVPHMTIARPRHRLTREDYFEISEWRSNYVVPDVTLTITEIALYTWAGLSVPNRFEIVQRRKLSGKK